MKYNNNKCTLVHHASLTSKGSLTIAYWINIILVGVAFAVGAPISSHDNRHEAATGKEVCYV